MYTRVAVVEGPYLKDILAQPVAMERTLQALPDLHDLRKRLQSLHAPLSVSRIVLTGMGSSFHALHPLSIQLNNAGRVAQMFETSELLTHYRDVLTPDTLIVAVSQSGESAEIVRLMAKDLARGPVVAITNSAQSTLATRADLAISTAAGEESSVSCKTYLCALMALHWLGAAILSQEPQSSVQASLLEVAVGVQQYVSEWQSHVDWFVEQIYGVDRVFVTGRGWSLATAGTGGLILKESTRMAAEGLSSAAFRHGPFESLSAKVLACVCLGDASVHDLNRRLSNDIHRAGGRAFLIGPSSEYGPLRVTAPSSLLPIVEILPVQMISLALSALLGQEAGRFTLASKVTSVE